MVQIIPSVRRCEKLASGRPGRRNRLPHLPCCTKVCKVGGAGGFACRANFSHALTLGAMCPPRKYGERKDEPSCFLCVSPWRDTIFARLNFPLADAFGPAL